MQKNISVNSTGVDTSLEGKPVYEALAVIPSTLMRTPSSAFAKAFDFLAVEGIYQIDVSVNDDNNSLLEFDKLSGFFRSSVGIHFVDLINETKATFDLSSEADGSKDVYFTMNFIENDSVNGVYPLDNFIFNVVDSGSDKPFSNAMKVLTLDLSSGAIGNIKIVAPRVSKPDYNQYLKMATIIGKKGIANSNLIKGDVVKIVGYDNNTGLIKVDKTTATTDEVLGVMSENVTSGNSGILYQSGMLINMDTSSLDTGNVYNDGNGGLTNTNGNTDYCGNVLVSDATNGIIFIDIVSNRIAKSDLQTDFDIKINDSSKGLILIDRYDGTNYRFLINNGNIEIEEV
jgi:hypothetical protein